MPKFAFKPKVNLFMYVVLLVFTPFLMLQNYLQSAIGAASRAEWMGLPYVLLIAILVMLLFSIYLIRNFTWKRLSALLVILVLITIGQLSTDFYFGHRYYDLQHNWHYLAYGLFSIIAYRVFLVIPRSISGIIYRVFFLAMSISLFDETIQVFISGRIFDLSDIGKDLWGCLIGMVFVFFVLKNGHGFKRFAYSQMNVRQMIKEPWMVLVFLFVFIYVFLVIGSVFTGTQFIGRVVFLSVFISCIIYLLIYLSRNSVSRYIILGLLAFVIFWGIRAMLLEGHVRYQSKDTVIYNGVPLYYFDYVIFPSGKFRPVDKKESFGMRDKQTIASWGADIVLIATGSEGSGGKGFNNLVETEFRYEPLHSCVYQVIKLRNKAACREYNRLVKEGKEVVFIIHNE